MMSIDEVSLNIENYEGQEIETRGFLLVDDAKQWYLSKEPNVKSCCVGKKKVLEIAIEGQFDRNLLNKAVTLQGSIEHNQLKNVKVISHTISPLLIFFVSLLTVLLFFIFRRFTTKVS